MVTISSFHAVCLYLYGYIEFFFTIVAKQFGLQRITLQVLPKQPFKLSDFSAITLNS